MEVQQLLACCKLDRERELSQLLPSPLLFNFLPKPERSWWAAVRSNGLKARVTSSLATNGQAYARSFRALPALGVLELLLLSSPSLGPSILKSLSPQERFLCPS